MAKIGVRFGAGLLLAGAAALAAGCNGGGGGGGRLPGGSGGGGGGGNVKSTGAAKLLARGGLGEDGGFGGALDIKASRAVRGGGGTSAKAKVVSRPSPRANAFQAAGDFSSDVDNDPADLDPSLDSASFSQDVLIPAAGLSFNVSAFATLESTQGSIFIEGAVSSDANTTSDPDGAQLLFRSMYGAIVVDGTIEASGDPGTGGDGGRIDLRAPVIVLGATAVLDASGADATSGDGGDGGDISIFESLLIGSSGIRGGFLAEEGAAIIVRGGNATAAGGDGGSAGDVSLDYTGDVVDIVFLGSIDGKGGASLDSDAGHGSGALIISRSGPFFGTDGNIVIAGTIDVSGGDGAQSGSIGGDGGTITLSAGGDITLLGATVTSDVSGGNARTGTPGPGGIYEALARHEGYTWAGDIVGTGGNATAGPGASGAFVDIEAPGERGDLRFTGNIEVFGTNATAGSDENGGDGGEVYFATLEGSINIVGDIDTHGGNGDGAGDGGDGGEVDILVDDLDPDPAKTLRLGNEGGTIFYSGTIDTRGGNAGTSGTFAGNGGDVVLDADGDDGEDVGNGGGTLALGSSIKADGGSALGSNGVGGDGGDVTLRGSDGTGSPSSSAGFNKNGVTPTFAGGTGSGGTNGTDGVPIFD